MAHALYLIPFISSGRLSARVWTSPATRQRGTAMRSRAERRRRLPILRLRARHGQLICLLHPQASAANAHGPRVLALIASGRAPFLRCFRLYGPAALPAPRRTPSAA